MTDGTVIRLFRYPVKGLSAEPMERLELVQGLGIAHDRTYALALGTTTFDPDHPKPLAKTNFLMLARNEALAALQTSFDPASHRLTIRRGGQVVAQGGLAEAEGRAAIGAWFTAFMGDAACGTARVVSSPGHRFSDIGAPLPALMDSLSLINLASLRALEAAMGRTLDPLRFRANIYIDGPPAWAEFDWIGETVKLGGVGCRAVHRTRRCPATNVDPSTAQRDADVPRALRERYGHADLGIYLQVEGSGPLAPGDTLEAPGHA